MAGLSLKVVRGKKRWIIDYYQYSPKKDKFVRKQILCDTKRATNDVLRKKLLQRYQEAEDENRRDVEIHGKSTMQVELTITDAINLFLEKRKKHVNLRQTHGGNQGISSSTYVELVRSMESFQEFCEEKSMIKCSEFNTSKAKQLYEWIEMYEGKAKNGISTFSKNKLIVNVKTFINSFRYADEVVFYDIDKITHVLKKFPVQENFQFYFKTDELQKILEKAVEHDCVKCKVTRDFNAKGKKFEDELPLKNIPILPHLLLVLFTGMRRSDALNLKWSDVNLVNASIKYQAIKNKKICTIPFNDFDHPVSPTMINILKIWDNLRNGDNFVLPHPKSLEPAPIKTPLEEFREKISVPELGFQNLRKTFESYAVTLGVPPAKAAFWVGHSTATAEKHYTAYAFGNLTGKSIEEAMGLKQIMTKIYNGYLGRGEYKNLKLTKWSP
ncbi:MAG: tyrosine-type recombinase/integrase [Planctomycetes bacterium]|nr:tyrosine-type recombinase/integrase [Planctomycetota bacterium]